MSNGSTGSSTTHQGVPGDQRQGNTADHSGGQSAFDTILGILGEAGKEAIPPLVDTAVDALFSNAVRDRIVQEAAEGLRDVLESARDALPDSETGQQLGQELVRAQRQLQPLLVESIENVFSGRVRADFQQHLEEAAEVLVQGDSEAAKQQAEEALQALLSEILNTLQGHWAQVLRLLLGIIAKGLEEALASHVKEAFASIAAGPRKEVEEQVKPLEEKLASKIEDLRERLIETQHTLHERLAEAREQVQERLGEAGSPGTGGGQQRQSRLGHPPSRRPPPGPTPRVPGKAPRGLPPSISG